MDATSGISSIINLIVQGLTDMYSLLDNFQFSGISLLDFMITIFVLGAVLPVILAILNTRTSSDIQNVRTRYKSRQNGGDDD